MEDGGAPDGRGRAADKTRPAAYYAARMRGGGAGVPATATPSLVACALTLAASLIEQAPVPGIMRSVGTPAETMASSRPMRSSADIELASELVPKTARPQPWLNSHLQCAMKPPTSGERPRLKS